MSTKKAASNFHSFQNTFAIILFSLFFSSSLSKLTSKFTSARSTVSTFSHRSLLSSFPRKRNVFPSFISYYYNQQSTLTKNFRFNTLDKASKAENLQMYPESDTIGYVDVGVNLLDPMYSGTYRGKHRHESDMSQIIKRASSNDVKKMIITAGTINESKEAYNLACTLRQQTEQILFFSSVGVHPTRCQQEFGFDANQPDDLQEHFLQEKINEMRELIEIGLSSEPKTIVTLGELGLDYARTEFCSIEIQKRGLLAQLKLALEFPQLPLFIHNRDTGMDLFDILKNYYCNELQQSTNANDMNISSNETPPLGVVHSFDGPLDLALKFIDLGFYIGINGCSLKTSENIETVKSIPLSKIVLETDGPWCDIRPSHASFPFVETKFPTKQEKKFESGFCVKNRTEPCHLVQVAEVIAGIKETSVKEVKEVCWKNTHDLFRSLS